jgi:hypothetical protein
MIKACRAAIAVLSLSGTAEAQIYSAPSEPARPPNYTELRYDEDYSYLKDPALRTDLFDPIKYVPLDQQGDWYASFGGEIRDRYEYFNKDLFGAGFQDKNGYNLLRVMANVDGHFGANLRVFLQGISATEQGRGGPRSSDIDQFNLHQAFVDVKIPSGANSAFTLRSGRQNMIFGDQRLIGVSDWTNVRRTFDAFRGTLGMSGNTVDVFYARPVLPAKYRFDNDVPGTDIAGVYETWQVPGALAKTRTQLELYLLYVNRESITFNQTTAGETRYTLGARLTATPRPFDIDIEFDYQLGRFSGEDIRAYSVAAIGGYTFENTRFAPRAFLGFDIASGDRRNGSANTFDQLFPSGHNQFGQIDAIGRQNIIDVHPGLDLTLLENQPYVQHLALTIEYRQFWRQSNTDAVYASNGTVLRASDGSSATEIGGEIDLRMNWRIHRHTNFYAGYSHFFHGPFIQETGPHNDIDFLYAAVTFEF